MSALGQKRTLKRFQPMSALPPKADIAGALVWSPPRISIASAVCDRTALAPPTPYKPLSAYLLFRGR